MGEQHTNWSVGILILRLFIGLRLVYGVADNVFSWAHMQEFAVFLESNGFPIPLASAIASVAVQFICGLCILLGYKTKPAALLLVLNFIIALVFFHLKIGDSIEGMTPAMAMLFGSLTIYFTGAGKFAVGK